MILSHGDYRLVLKRFPLDLCIGDRFGPQQIGYLPCGVEAQHSRRDKWTDSFPCDVAIAINV